jgi:hypothetical protein
MNTVAILPISSISGEKSYRAILGDKQWVEKTAGQALDGLTDQLEENEFRALLVIQSFEPDQFFRVEQQQRLGELMSLWRLKQKQGQLLLRAQQLELDDLVDAELKAATARTEILMP